MEEYFLTTTFDLHIRKSWIKTKKLLKINSCILFQDERSHQFPQLIHILRQF